MAERRCGYPDGCPDIDPVTGRYKGSSTMSALVDGTPQLVTVQKADLMSAARSVRLEAISSVVGVGGRARDQMRTVSATLQGSPVTAEVSGSVLTSEARLVRTTQARDLFVSAGKALGRRAARPAPARA